MAHRRLSSREAVELVRYPNEGTPGLRDVAKVTASLAKLEL